MSSSFLKFLLLTPLIFFTSCGDFHNPELNKLGKTIKEKVQRKGFMTNGQIEQMVVNFGDNIIAPTTLELHNNAKEFKNELQLHCKKPSQVIDNSDLKKSWKKLITTYHTASAFIDEKNLGQEITFMYSWPETKSYNTDLRIANFAAKNREIKLGSNSVKGLDILEYLVFDEDYMITCRQGRKCKRNVIKWNSKDKASRVKDRCAYMNLIIAETLTYTEGLSVRWNPDDSSYITEALRNGVYGNLNQTVKVFSDALFYFEKNVKDKRVGVPSGLNDECEKDSCPEKSEHTFANFSIQSILASLKGLKTLLNGTQVLTGKDGVGFDDYLITTGNAKVYIDLDNSLNKAISNFKKYLSTNVKDLSTNINASACSRTNNNQREEVICALYSDLKEVADIMKGEFLAALKIQAPRQVQGDND